MRNINELIGIINGISYDGIINKLEVARLSSWVKKNRNPDLAIAVFTQLKEERERRKELENTTLIQRQQIAQLQPKASYYDLILQNTNTFPITQIAKDYGMSGRKFNALLHELGIQYKFRKTWLLYQNYADQGYTQSKTHQIDEHRSVMHTYWTQKGRIFLYDILKNEGILPLIEIED